MTPAEKETYDERYAICIVDADSDKTLNHLVCHQVALDAVERERQARKKQVSLVLDV